MTTKPWDIFNPGTQWCSQEEYESRILICKGCENFINVTKQCKKCGCHMPTKAKMKLSECPIKKW